MSEQYKCSICGQLFDRPYHVTKHRREVHPDMFRKRNKKSTDISAIDLMIEGKDKIKEALKLVDQELSQLHDRTNQLVDMAAKYKKLL